MWSVLLEEEKATFFRTADYTRLDYNTNLYIMKELSTQLITEFTEHRAK
jgi:hypothetical protein